MTFEERRARGLWRGLNAWENGVPRRVFRDGDFRALEGWDAGMKHHREQEARHNGMITNGKTYYELLVSVVNDRRMVEKMINDVKTEERCKPFRHGFSEIDDESYFWLQMRFPAITSWVHEALENGGLEEAIRRTEYKDDVISRQLLHDVLVLASAANKKKAEERRRLRRKRGGGPISRILRRFGL